MGMPKIVAICLGAACWASSLAAAGPGFGVPQELWERPRSGAVMLAQPVLRQSVEALLSRPDSRLLIHHGGSEESLLQAEELRAWLIALAVDSGRIELKSDARSKEPLTLEIADLPAGLIEGKPGAALPEDAETHIERGEQ